MDLNELSNDPTMLEKLIGVIAYSYFHDIKSAETSVKRYLSLPDEERARWQRMDQELTSDFLGSIPDKIANALIINFVHSKQRYAQENPGDNGVCDCENCSFMNALIAGKSLWREKQAKRAFTSFRSTILERGAGQ